MATTSESNQQSNSHKDATSEGVVTTTTTTTQAHYEGHSQESYESAYFYSPGAYMDYLEEKVVEALQLQSQHGRLLDIGGGTGNFTRRLLPHLDSAVIVDPFLSADADTPSKKDDRLTLVSAAAEDFAEDAAVESASLPDWRTNYDYILLKEVVHHLDNRVAIFRGLHRALKDHHHSDDDTQPHRHPQLLLVTRPQTDLDYPLWPAALDVWAQHQPSAQELKDDLQQAGFTQVEATIHSYPCEIPLATWQSMVRQRFWSTFAHFSDDELQAACADMPVTQATRLQQKDGILRFDDRLVFLTAWK